MTNFAQRAFAAGELCPSLYARTDLAKYGLGLRTCRNFIVNRFGGVSNRAGTEYIAATKSNAAVRLLPFVLSVTDAAQSYLLVFGDHYIRFVQDAGSVVVQNPAAWVNATVYKVGDLVSQSSVAYYCKVAHTAATGTNKPGVDSGAPSVWYTLTGASSNATYEIPTPYAVADVAELQIQQSGDVVTIVHPNYAPRELKRFGHTNWTLTAIAFGPTIIPPANLAVSGGSTVTHDTYYAVTAISAANGDEGTATTVKLALKNPDTAGPVTLTWDPTPGALSYVVYRGTDGQTFGFVGQAGGVPLPKTQSTWTTTSGTASTVLQGQFIAGTDQARTTVLASAQDRASDGTYIIAARLTVGASADLGTTVDGRVRAYYSRDGETRVDAGIIATAHESEGSITVSFVGAITVPDNGYTTLIVDLVAEVMGSGSAATYSATVSTATAPDNTVTWSKTGTGFSDNGILIDFGIGPPKNPSLFAAAGKYPTAVGAFQQRRFFANTTASPETVWASRTAIPASFTTSTPIQDDDAITFTLASRQLADVRHLVDIGRLLIFTSAGEWIAEGDNSNIIKPNAINARQFSAHGSASLAPIVVGSGALFVHARSTIVRDLSADTVQGLSSNDLSIYAAHLFDGYSLVDWAFAEIPHHVVWVVRSDGTLLGLTYMPEQDVWGWHRHDTDGTVENVCVVPEGTEDSVYLVVKRTVNGATVRYLERMAARSITALTDVRDLIFMDAAISYDGRNFDPTVTMTVSGGSAWDQTETVTVTRSAANFTNADIGGAIVVYADASDSVELFRVAIESVSSSTVISGHPSAAIPVSNQNVATSQWGKAAITFTGADHLNGKAVSVLGDGAVIASPKNADYGTPLTVVAGAVTIPQACVVVHIGLPYLADIETLDIDTAQGPSLKAAKMLISKVTFVVEKSRAFFVGSKPPTNDTVDPLEKLDQSKLRDVSDDYNLPTLKTDDFTVTLQASWNSNGRIFVRQPDPVPLSVLAAIPQGQIPPTN